ncbi:MAG: hypothetical protein WC413_04625, partial [Candidatus Nanoarchaeia archaeon]
MTFACRKSKLQEYGCQVCVKPKWKSKHEWICFDMCLAKELFYLWDLGIVTTGCCCGRHEGENGDHSYIEVEERFIPEMKKLGYKTRYNSFRTKDEEQDSFIPKTFYSIEEY